MNRRIELTRLAAADIEEIARFTQEHWGADQRRRYLAGLERRIAQLSETPRMGQLRDEILPGHRSIPYVRHVIFYQESADGIRITRIVHASMELKRRLRPARERGE